MSIYRDYWDPTFTSPSGTINQIYTTQIQPNHAIPFRIPRMRAIANSIYPGTPLAITEWSAEFAGGSDFSTALGDADAYGILGRERVSLASRWVAPDPANPNYQALKLYTNYDGVHHGFAPISVSDSNTGNVNLFSSYAAVDSAGTTMTVMIINKDPQKATEVTFNMNGFTPNLVASYTLAATAPNTIAATTPVAWSLLITVAPNSATLLVIAGASTAPGAEWDLNPDTIMVPAGGTVTLNPTITSGSGNVSLGSAVFDVYAGAAACSGTLTITTSAITTTTNGAVDVVAGDSPGFCHYSVTGTDSAAVTQKQGGWIVVGNPPATLTNTDSGQGGTVTVKLAPGASGGSASGASIFFTTDNGTLSQRIVTTDSSGNASVTLTLPSGSTAHVTAEGPYGLGHPLVTFAETAP